MKRRNVYVIGAGFSASLGFPLTRDLLVRLWSRLESPLQKRLKKVIQFHHTSFDPKRATSFPNIELLLSNIDANLELFRASRAGVGGFKEEDLRTIRQSILSETAVWFHQILGEEDRWPEWIKQFGAKLSAKNAVVVSFNWDLVLEKLLFSEGIENNDYGFGESSKKQVILLKPHGSLNWFEKSQAIFIAKDRRVKVFNESDDAVYAFLRFRAPKSRREREYTPLIVPPIQLKNFDKPIFQTILNNVMSFLSTAEEVYFLGYSMPETDLHAKFIMRCGFYNQIRGLLKSDGSRKSATGPAKVTIVNPDQEAARRIENIVGRRVSWIPMPIEHWISKDATET